MARQNTGTTYRVAIDTEHTFIYIDAADKKDLIRFLVDNYVGEHSIRGVKRLGWDGMLYSEDVITNPYFQEYSAQKQNLPPQEEQPKRVSILCEEYEASDGIREFSVLAVSEDRDALKEYMQAKIREDEYGYIKSNGVFDQGDTHFTTNFNDGFLDYYILEQNVLSQDQIQAKIRSTKNKSLMQPGGGEKPSLDLQVKIAQSATVQTINTHHQSNKER